MSFCLNQNDAFLKGLGNSFMQWAVALCTREQAAQHNTYLLPANLGYVSLTQLQRTHEYDATGRVPVKYHGCRSHCARQPHTQHCNTGNRCVAAAKDNWSWFIFKSMAHTAKPFSFQVWLYALSIYRQARTKRNHAVSQLYGPELVGKPERRGSITTWKECYLTQLSVKSYVWP